MMLRGRDVCSLNVGSLPLWALGPAEPPPVGLGQEPTGKVMDTRQGKFEATQSEADTASSTSLIPCGVAGVGWGVRGCGLFSP